MYVGKTLDEIKESNVIICNTEKEGEMYQLNDFFDEEKTVKKESGVNEWIYLYVDETGTVGANLGTGRKKINKKFSNYCL